ncbi:MAG: helix-turn-helix transcriptional regulator [Desulfobaccales bacterium]
MYNLPMIISKRIVELRTEKTWTQEELAEKVGVHFRSIGRWERGEALPGAEELLKLAQAFGVTADYLLFEGAPRDGRVDIPDSTLLKLFEEISTMDDETRTVAKQLLDALVFKKKVSEEVGKRA